MTYKKESSIAHLTGKHNFSETPVKSYPNPVPCCCCAVQCLQFVTNLISGQNTSKNETIIILYEKQLIACSAVEVTQIYRGKKFGKQFSDLLTCSTHNTIKKHSIRYQGISSFHCTYVHQKFFIFSGIELWILLIKFLQHSLESRLQRAQAEKIFKQEVSLCVVLYSK